MRLLAARPNWPLKSFEPLCQYSGLVWRVIFPYLSLHWAAYWEILASASNINTKCCLGRKSHDAAPYTRALEALQDRYGQPRQLIWRELDAIFGAPALRKGDTSAFESFAMSIQCLVPLLTTLEGKNKIELRCSSHVDCLLSKMPTVWFNAVQKPAKERKTQVEPAWANPKPMSKPFCLYSHGHYHYLKFLLGNQAAEPRPGLRMAQKGQPRLPSLWGQVYSSSSL